MQPYEIPSFGQLAGDARCARHPTLRAVITCERCGDYCCPECYDVGRDFKDYCHACSAEVAAPLASRVARLGAQCINIFAAMLIFGMPSVGALFLSANRASDSDVLLLMLAVFSMIACFSWLSVNLWFLHKDGQSVGKKLVGIRIVRVDGTRAGLGRLVFARYLLPAFIAQFCGLFSIIDALFIFNDDQRCIHDHFAETIVVQAMEPKSF